jgi:hypothetical protein
MLARCLARKCRLGVCLVAIRATVATLATSMDLRYDRAIAVIPMLVLPSEGLNALGMRRVGSPYVVPMLFILLTIAGVALAVLTPDVGRSILVPTD